MKYHFVLNPAAGQGNKLEALEKEIRELGEKRGIDFTVYRTTGRYDAERYAREICAAGPEEEHRFYFAGGDGTLNEGVNGLFGFRNAAAGVIPIGTGNDFVRNFTDPQNFRSVAAQIDAKPVDCDLIRYGERVFVNMFNTGLDCQVASYVSELKKKPLLGGSAAYLAGVVKALVRMPGVSASVSFDGGEPVCRDLQLFCAGNGSWCGGGFKSAPYADLNDGRMDVCVVNRVSRATVIRIIGAYKKGTHVTEKNKKILQYIPCRRASIVFDRPTEICLDGEIETVGRLELEVLPAACRILVPAGSKKLQKDPLPAAALSPAELSRV